MSSSVHIDNNIIILDEWPAEAIYFINFIQQEKKRFVLRLHYNGSNEKAGLKGVVNFFSVDFNPIDANDILDTHIK